MNSRATAALASLALVATFSGSPATAPIDSREATRPASVSQVETARRQPPGLAVRATVSRVCTGLEGGYGCRLVSRSREPIGRGIAEYTYVVKVGPGRHDLIKVHRVVRERRPGSAAVTRQAVMLVHGDVWGFDPAFAGKLGGPGRAPNVAGWLAARGVDVWGIDLRWVSVPAATTNLGFMRSWGPRLDLQDIRVATTIERAIRGLTGSGFGRTALLGWSRGGFHAYAYANYESKLAKGLRNVDALIPAETVLKYAPQFDESRRHVCGLYRDGRQALEDGVFATDFRVLRRLGRLAVVDPLGPSPFVDGLTNRQTLLFFASYVGGVFSPWYHFVAAIFNPAGIPTGLMYTPVTRLSRLYQHASPWQNETLAVTSSKIWCGKPDPLVDNLRGIHLPVLYLGAAGGFGEVGVFSTKLLGSSDVTSVLVRLRPRGQEARDFGHVDLWQARNAPRLVWRPLLDWLRAH